MRAIYGGAFYGYSNLTSVTNLATDPSKGEYYEPFSVYGTLHVLPGCKAAYEASDVWKDFTIVEDAEIPTEITGIADVETNGGKKNGKYLVNGKIVIVRNGKSYNLSGQIE